MSEMGQTRRSDGSPATSGLPHLADIFPIRRHVSKVPQPDSCNAAKLFDHLVGEGEEVRWHSEAERLGGLEIDD
jgi:hypothetical protein